MKSLNNGVQERSRAGVETAVQGNTRFALDLYQALRSTEGNLFFSPYSISTALAMTYAGARGDTETQIAQALHFRLNQKQLHPAFALLDARLAEAGRNDRVQLRVANTLWPQMGYDFLEAFLELTKLYYRVLITTVDYGDTEAARHTINAWVEDRTESRIKELIPPGLLDPLTCLVLVNAVYFRGDWASRFDRALTHKAPFRITPDEQIQAMMMTQQRAFKYGENDGLQILELPYAGNDLSMLVLLPGEPDGLAELEGALTVENLDRWTQTLDEEEVVVTLPRFEITLPFRLDATLQSMGMVDAFSARADFSGMNGSRELFIAAVLHKAFVTVNEEGTEAAAATAVLMLRGLPAPPPVFRADHPFLFLIRENSTGSVLFLGRVVNPACRTA